MTRRIVVVAMLGATLVIAGCGERQENGSASDTTSRGWVAAPVIDSAVRTGSRLTLRGHARPGSRVVIRGEAGTAFAVNAGDEGRFDVQMPPPTRDMIYVVEVQDGETAVPSPFRLLVASDPGGPMALIGAGSPTRRLDPGAGLDVIDSDGRSKIASGRAAPRAVVTIEFGARSPIAVTTGNDGRWSVGLGTLPGGEVTLLVAGRSYIYPGDGLSRESLNRLVRMGQGQALRWSLSDTAGQTSWFPDRQADSVFAN